MKKPIDTLIGIMGVTHATASDTLRKYADHLELLAQAVRCYSQTCDLFGCASEAAAADLAILKDAGDQARRLLKGQ